MTAVETKGKMLSAKHWIDSSSRYTAPQQNTGEVFSF